MINTKIFLNKIFHKLNKPPQNVLSKDSIFRMKHFDIKDYISPVSSEIFEKTNNKIIFHTYWKGEFGRKQAFSVKSLLATQVDYKYEVWLWLDSKDKKLNSSNKYLNELRKYIVIKYYNPKENLLNHPFNKILFLFEDYSNLAFRADGFRMWALSEFGGVWFDLDIMFIRNMKEFWMGSEFVYSWEKQGYANNALIYLRKDSYTNRYLAKKVLKKHSTQPWALFNYKDKHLKELTVFPASLFDPLWGLHGEKYIINSFEEFFDKIVDNNKIPIDVFPYSYTYHWHNLWDREIKSKSLFSNFEKYFEKIIQAKEKI